MSKKSIQPTSNLDKIAYGINISVIICAIISVSFAIYFLKQSTIYSYYVSPAIILLVSSIISVISAILGFKHIIKTIIKHRT